MNFVDLAEEVMTQRERDGVRGLDREVSRYRCHISTAPFAMKELADIGSPDVREWLRLMADKRALGPGEERTLSRQTVSRCQSFVSAVFIEAVEREYIKANPCFGVKPKKRVDERDTRQKWACLTPDEQALIRNCAAIPYADRLCIRFAIATGLRQGEQRHLEIADVVTEGPEPEITVRYAGRRNGKKLPPKSGKVRVVPLFGDGLIAAREWLRLLPTYAPENPEGLMFPSSSGRLRQQGKFLGKSDTLRRYYRAAGVKLRPHLHWHALRHTFATNLLTGVCGEEWRRIELVQIAMGHSSVVVTQRYAHAGADALRDAARKTRAAMAEIPSPPDTTPDLAMLASMPAQVMSHAHV